MEKKNTFINCWKWLTNKKIAKKCQKKKKNDGFSFKKIQKLYLFHSFDSRF